jgi:hypothetical protein
MKLTIKRLRLKISHRLILDLNIITQLFPNLLGLLKIRYGNNLVNKKMITRTLGIQGRNRIKIIINIKDKNLINTRKKREARGGLME